MQKYEGGKTRPKAVRSNAQVWGRLTAGNEGSNPAEVIVVSAVICVGSDLCDELIIRSGVLLGVCLIVCDLETSKMRKYTPYKCRCATTKVEKFYSFNYKIWYRDNRDNGISLVLR